MTLLACSVGLGTLLIGLPLAWLTAACEFPFRRFFSWALVLPMALPAYVIAFVDVALLDYTGPLRTWLRSLGLDALAPEIRSYQGLVLVLSCALYPYVYLAARSAFLSQGVRMMEVAQSLGCSPIQAFFRAALPAARPWIMGGMLLVMMETMADFGAVSIFNYSTLTTAVYQAWFGFFSLADAARIASLLVLAALVFMAVESYSRRRRRYATPSRSDKKGERLRLQGWKAALATLFCVLILSIAFAVPAGQITLWALERLASDLNVAYLSYLRDSLFLALVGTALVTFCGLSLVYARRLHPDRLMRVSQRLSLLGYALPGSVLAIGFYIPVAWMDQGLDALGLNLALKATPLVLLLGYLSRFLVMSHSSVSAAMERIRPSLDESAMSLGRRGLSMLKEVHFPLLRGGLATSAVMVFVEILKEMPMTLMTRPLGRDTLAVKIFEFTSEGEWKKAALPALLLLLAGLLPVILLTRSAEVSPSGKP